MAALLGVQSEALSARVGRYCTRADVNRSATHPCEEAVFAQHYVENRFVVHQRCNDNIRLRCRFARRLRSLRTCCDEGLNLFSRAVVDHEMTAGSLDIFGDTCAHPPQTN